MSDPDTKLSAPLIRSQQHRPHKFLNNWHHTYCYVSLELVVEIDQSHRIHELRITDHGRVFTRSLSFEVYAVYATEYSVWLLVNTKPGDFADERDRLSFHWQRYEYVLLYSLNGNATIVLLMLQREAAFQDYSKYVMRTETMIYFISENCLFAIESNPSGVGDAFDRRTRTPIRYLKISRRNNVICTLSADKSLLWTLDEGRRGYVLSAYDIKTSHRCVDNRFIYTLEYFPRSFLMLSDVVVIARHEYESEDVKHVDGHVVEAFDLTHDAMRFFKRSNSDLCPVLLRGMPTNSFLIVDLDTNESRLMLTHNKAISVFVNGMICPRSGLYNVNHRPLFDKWLIKMLFYSANLICQPTRKRRR